MTTLVLQAAGSVVGGIANGAIGAATSALGGLVSGAFAGGGATHSLKQIEGPRLQEMSGLASTEGAPIPRLYGRARLGGQLIWATRFEEIVQTTTETTVQKGSSSGGKGGGGKRSTSTTVTTSYSYVANLAIGLCEGPIAFVRRVWADGREIDLTTLTMRVHRGDESQAPDPLIVAKEGAGSAPAYRGLAYVVFERLPLGVFGNRVPQFAFEVVRAVDGLGGMIQAVCLIPGASEFGYDTVSVMQDLGLGRTQPENRHQLQRVSDVLASLDALQALLPNLKRVSVVATWFGDDLRAGACTITPKVEIPAKTTIGAEWQVSNLVRWGAPVVSRVNGIAAYGGTPSDQSVIRLIRELKARGLGVVLYPFVMMDVPAGSGRPDPHTGAPDQPPYPWRGRITSDPAPGRPGSPDGTPAAGAQVDAFFGIAQPGDFTVAGEVVAYLGPQEWSFRRLVLHYAHLAEAAGGVEAFLVGSELVGLTRVRSASGQYPAVGHLRQLAGDVRAVLGPGPRLSYGADWTEYGAHVLGGGAEIRFPLDPLWADPAIDAVGIDYYPPVSDWRDGPDHLDLSEARSSQDTDYLRRRLASGEAFDWYYADAAGRAAQARLPITDGQHGKPWIYRAKDLVGWWANSHVERVGGVEIGATAWQPEGKPIWLTEIGIPAVDKGANAPNVFPDPKSSESAIPYFSRGLRDDLVQARGLEAILTRFDPALPGYPEGANPVSSLYGGRMVEPGHVFVWAWDARPFPAFPDFDLVWADGANWQGGHWITGRIEGVPLDRLVAAILADFGLAPGGALPLDGFVDGYVVDRPMSARAALEPLATLFGFDVAASGGGLVWRGRGGRVDLRLTPDDFAAAGEQPVLSLTRAQETELPHQVEIGFTDAEAEYPRAAVGSRRLAGSSRREARLDSAVVTRRAEAQRLADQRLADLWAGREAASFRLARHALALTIGDVVDLATPAGPALHRIHRIVEGPLRQVETRAVEPAVFDGSAAVDLMPRRRSQPAIAGRPFCIVLDLPAARGDPLALQYLAVAADPWPGAMAIWRAGDGNGFTLHRIVDLPALVGRTLTSMPPGPVWRWDRAASLDVTLSAASLSAVDDLAALSGANLFALEGPGGWEILSAAQVELTGERDYRLTRFLRGLAGSEASAATTVPAGARIVRLDAALVPLSNGIEDLGRTWTYRIGPADRDYADPAYLELAATAGPLALRPLAPVHVTARREAGGIRLAWIRRGRVDADGWEPVDIPLGETSEAYEVDILSGSTLLRTLPASTPQVLYPAADELADFGQPQATLSLRLAQMSAVVGRGLPRIVTVRVD